MNRDCIKFPLSKFLEDNKNSFKDIKLIDVELYIDSKNSKEIIAFLKNEQHKKKLKDILYYILQGKTSDGLYRKEGVSTKAKDITAMKFSGKLNPRIYCKEFFKKGKKIVMIVLLDNKNFQKANNKSLKPKLESIGGYEYELK